MKLAGKVALVTGGGTGVGSATALALAERDCAVVVNYSRSRDGAESTAEQARAHGVAAVVIQADVSRDEECRRLVSQTLAAMGRLDVLVNNAATTSFIPHGDLDAVGPDDWDRIFRVNLQGPFGMARAARAALTAHGDGEIVNVSSMAAFAATGSSIPYCASKAALNNLTVALARVLAPAVRVNAVAPGFIDGSWLRDGLGERYDAVKSAMEQRAVLGKVCTPEDVAAAIVSLVAGSDLVTGQVLCVDGGRAVGTGF